MKPERSTVSLFIAAAYICIAALSGSLAHSGEHKGDAHFTKHFNETLFALGEKGQMSIELLLDEKEYKIGKDVIGIVVHDSHDEDVEDASLAATVTGTAEPLKVKEKGGGLYLVPSAGLPKEGKWELKIAVKKKKVDDSVTFVFPEVSGHKMPAGKYDKEGLKGKKLQ
ncbi:MAG: hypothetical protein FIA94_08045 [Nitrospirae bacterium]|nr:hypothetical protein [Nitrospirota bacterium]